MFQSWRGDKTVQLNAKELKRKYSEKKQKELVSEFRYSDAGNSLPIDSEILCKATRWVESLQDHIILDTISKGEFHRSCKHFILQLPKCATVMMIKTSTWHLKKNA